MHNHRIPKTTHLTTAALLAGPMVTTAGMALTPWEDEFTTQAYQAALAADPVQAQWAAITLAFGYALLGLTLFTVLRHAEHRGAPPLLRRAAAVAAFFAATILPGLVSVDFYDLALAQTLPVDQAVAVADQVHTYGLAAILRVASGIGFLFGGILTLSTAWKAGIAPGWSPLLAVGSLVLPIAAAGPAAFIGGSALMLVTFGSVAVRLRAQRATDVPAREPVADVDPALTLAV
ncbi:MAG: hypothetical protein PGN13_02485 [Patulibacter minatonensis]